jgi:ribose transport system ATP-binding protein
LRLGRLRADVLGSLTDFEVHPLAPDRLMSTFSGGNQQKAVLAKWLQTNPKVLLLHEPTQGVDVGARKQIFALIRAATAQGTAAVIASSEHEDLGHLCDRVLVFRDGRVAAELSGAQVNPQRILDESYRVSVASHASAQVAVAGANAPEGQS